MKEVTDEFYKAALELARYIDQFDDEFDELEEFVGGGDPKQHVLYSAAIVGGWVEEFEKTVNSY